MSLCVEETRDTDSGRCQTKTGIWSDKYLNPWLMGMTYRWKQLNSRSYNTCVYIRIYLDINIFYVCVVHFDMKMRVAPQRRAIFNVSAEQLHPELGIIEKTQRFATFLTFAACVSSFQWLYSRVDRLSAVYSRVDCLSADLTSAFQLSIHKSLPFLLFVVTRGQVQTQVAFISLTLLVLKCLKDREFCPLSATRLDIFGLVCHSDAFFTMPRGSCSVKLLGFPSLFDFLELIFFFVCLNNVPVDAKTKQVFLQRNGLMEKHPVSNTERAYTALQIRIFLVRCCRPVVDWNRSYFLQKGLAD